MPRPKRVADEEILDAASALLAEKGSIDFTLAEVAAKVGLSRAALIQRFENRDRILRAMAAREVVLTERYLASLPLERSLEGLRAFLDEIVGSMGRGEEFGGRVLFAWLEAHDPALRIHADQRYRLVQAAIAARVPVELGDAEMIARHLHAVVAGASMQWVARQDTGLADAVLARLDEAFSLLLRN